MSSEPARAGHAARHAPRALLLACALALTACGAGEGASPTPTPIPEQRTVERPTYRVARGDIVEELRLSGRVAAVRQQDLGFEQAGRVLRVRVATGDTVKKGQLLAELEQRELETNLARAQVALDQAKLVLQRGQNAKRFATQRAQLDLEEAQTILDQADTDAERTLAEIGVRRARIGLQEARAITNEEAERAVDQAQLEYDRLAEQVEAGKLYAPFAGVVSGVGAEPGQEVEAFAPVVSIADPSEREVRVENVTGQELNQLSAQQEVTLRFNRFEDRPVEGVIERLPQDPNDTQTDVQTDDAVHISYDPGELDLEIGDLAAAIVTLQRKENVLFLPPAALRSFQGRQFVVVQQGERQRRVDVTVGISDDRRVEIVEGLSGGQVVVGQ